MPVLWAIKANSLCVPRVKTQGGPSRLHCDQYSGMFISDHRCSDVQQILYGLPHAVLLQTMHGELSVLVSAAAKPERPPSEMFPGEIRHRSSMLQAPVLPAQAEGRGMRVFPEADAPSVAVQLPFY